jgi:Protein of unknown function (DUF3237)
MVHRKNGHRRTLLEKNLLYVMSEDGNIEDGREDIGFVPGGLRLNLHSREQDSRIYNVAGDKRMLGEFTLSGTIVWGGDSALARDDDLEILEVRIVIRTDDGAYVEAEYTGLFAPGPRSFRQLVTEKPKLGSETNPFEGKYFSTPKFYSSDPRYRWLNGRQCVAIGRVKLIDCVARQATFDCWLMD